MRELAGKEYNEEIAELRKEIGARIKKLRQSKELSQYVLAGSVGISQNYLSLVESGRYKISDILMMKIANELDTTIQYLMGFDEKPEIEEHEATSPKEDQLFEQPTIESSMDTVDRAIVILRSVVKNKDKLAPEDKQILRDIMNRGARALEEDPLAKEITDD